MSNRVNFAGLGDDKKAEALIGHLYTANRVISHRRLYEHKFVILSKKLLEILRGHEDYEDVMGDEHFDENPNIKLHGVILRDIDVYMDASLPDRYYFMCGTIWAVENMKSRDWFK